MKKHHFYILYFLLLYLLSPMNTITFIAQRCSNPEPWQEWCLLCGSVLFFAGIVVLGCRLHRWFPSVPATEPVKRIGTVKFPWQKNRDATPETQSKDSPLNNIYLITALVLCLHISDSWKTMHRDFSDFIDQGYFRMADIYVALGCTPDAGYKLYSYCATPCFHEEERTRRITYLLENGANPNKGPNWRTPVDACMHEKNRHLLPLLFSHGGKLEWVPEKFMLPHASLAAHEAEPEFLRYLIQHGADVNTPDTMNRDKTPLHYALSWSHHNKDDQLECVRLLLEAGADVNAMTRDGCTPLDIHASNDGPIAALLRQHGGLFARELPFSLKLGEKHLTAKLRAANPECGDADLRGVLQLKNTEMPFTYHHTGKGNGFITVRGDNGPLEIRCYDEHDNGSYYAEGWADITLDDINDDSHPDIVVEYTEFSGDCSIGTPMRSVYLYHPTGYYFKHLYTGPKK